MIMGSHDMMSEGFLLDDPNNFVGDLIVETVNDRCDVSFIEDFVVSIETDDEIRIFTRFGRVRPYYILGIVIHAHYIVISFT